MLLPSTWWEVFTPGCHRYLTHPFTSPGSCGISLYTGSAGGDGAASASPPSSSTTAVAAGAAGVFDAASESVVARSLRRAALVGCQEGA